MITKIRIKVDAVEFEYEGETPLSLTEIKELFSYIGNLSASAPSQEKEYEHIPLHPANADQVPSLVSGQKLHVNSVAKKLAAKTGAQVAEAAAVTLQIYEGKETFSRNELLNMMKKATMYYKESMASYLTKILDTLVGTSLNQVSDGVYSLSADAFADLQTRLA